MRLLLKAIAGIGGLLLAVLLVGWWYGAAVGVPAPALKSPTAPLGLERTSPQQAPAILFGDLHVHSNYSLDARIFNTPAMKGTYDVTPVDACDYARYCSALDFWSINDHAEALSAGQWQATKTAIRQCNAQADPVNPDLVSFLGWEWSQSSVADVAQHYGHKNVIFRDTDEGQVPVRPIASGPNDIWRLLSTLPAALRGLWLLWMSGGDMSDYRDLAHHMQAAGTMPDCEQSDVRELPSDCYEYAETPAELFEKLDQWGFPALVIPHGMTWGNTNPAGSDIATQLDQHNPRYQRLLEVYSGHGNSEVYRDLPLVQAGDQSCPSPANGFTPCCWRAGEIIAQRCTAKGGSDCEDRAARASDRYMQAINGGILKARNARSVVPDSHPDEWGQCDQLADSFQPSYDYQPAMSAQYALTLAQQGRRFRTGFIASSDTHSGRGGSGYKELDRFWSTDTKDTGQALPQPDRMADESREASPGLMAAAGAGDAFYFSSGLVAVHSTSRDRRSIWQALQQRHVYGTSGPRIHLWFDLVAADGSLQPMGSQTSVAGVPRFKVRASGSLQQRPGCPEPVVKVLGETRVANLCRGECYFPGNERVAMQRIEVIRVLERVDAKESSASLIQDPWRVFDCSATGAVCDVEFSDDSFPTLGREAAYYVRALQVPTATIQGDPFACETAADGSCLRTRYCIGVDTSEDCLRPARHRAWSSPIFVRGKYSSGDKLPPEL